MCRDTLALADQAGSIAEAADGAWRGGAADRSSRGQIAAQTAIALNFAMGVDVEEATRIREVLPVVLVEVWRGPEARHIDDMEHEAPIARIQSQPPQGTAKRRLPRRRNPPLFSTA